MKKCAKTDNKSVGENTKAKSWLGRIIGLVVAIGIASVAVMEAYPKFQSEIASSGAGHPTQGPAATPPPAPEQWTTVHLLGWWHESEECVNIPQNGPPFEFFAPKEGVKVVWADGSTDKLIPGRAADLSGHFGQTCFKGPKGETVDICIGARCRTIPHPPRADPLREDQPPGKSGSEVQKMASDDSCDRSNCPYRR